MTPEEREWKSGDPLTVEIVVPHYLFSLLLDTYASDPESWVSGVVECAGECTVIGDFHGIENADGEWLICVHDGQEDGGQMRMRTHIESVSKITVL